jgi:hypothetical protein
MDYWKADTDKVNTQLGHYMFNISQNEEQLSKITPHDCQLILWLQSWKMQLLKFKLINFICEYDYKNKTFLEKSVSLSFKEHNIFSHLSNWPFLVTCHGFRAVQLLMRPRYIRLIHSYVNGERIHLRTTDTNRLIVHPQGYMLTWRAMVVVMLAEKNSWLVHHSSVAILPAESSGSK